VGLAYLLLTLFTDFRIPCLFHELTGLKCPGCGITRMILSLVRLDFASAFRYNPLLFITGPVILGYIVFYEITYILKGCRPSKKWDAMIYVVLILVVAYGILRNVYPI
jgi:hypothetical protein